MTTTPIFSPERARRDSEDPRFIVVPKPLDEVLRSVETNQAEDPDVVTL